jgi:hypothetical protein
MHARGPAWVSVVQKYNENHIWPSCKCCPCFTVWWLHWGCNLHTEGDSVSTCNSRQQHHDAVSSQLQCSSLQGTIKAMSRTCDLGLLLGLLSGAELLALMPA